jgi:hypothetical protein
MCREIQKMYDRYVQALTHTKETMNNDE